MAQTDHQMKIRLDPRCKDWLERQAAEQERSRTWIINRLIKDEMQHCKNRDAENVKIK